MLIRGRFWRLSGNACQFAVKLLNSADLQVSCVDALAASPAAFAHTKSETQSVWRIVGSTIHVAYTIPDIELPRLAHSDRARQHVAEIVYRQQQPGRLYLPQMIRSLRL